MAEKPWTKTSMKVRAGDLKINPRVQRDVHPAHVRTLAREWNELLVGTVTGWKIGDDIFLLDGQQRLRAKTGGPKLAGVVAEPDPDYVFDCDVYEGITEKQAAEIFLGLNRGRKNVDAYARWWVELTEGDEIALAMKRAADRAGLSISTNSTKHEISCVSTMRRVISRRGTMLQNEDALVWALHMYATVWGHSPAWRSEMVEALAVLKLKYGAKVNDVEAVKRFSGLTVDGALGKARLYSVGSNRMMTQLVKVLQEEYDYGRRSHKRLEAQAA